MTFLYLAALAAIYGLLTWRRTVAWPVLAFYVLVGLFSYFLHSGVAGLLGPPGEATLPALGFLGLLDVLLLTAPVVLLLHATDAGQGSTLFDGLALGAALGLGFLAVPVLGGESPVSPLAPWPPGAVAGEVFSPGLLAWAALLGFGAAAGRRLRRSFSGWWLVPILLAAWVAFEMVLAWGGAPRVPYSAWLLRGSGVLLGLLLVLAWMVEETWLARASLVYPLMRLESEGARATGAGELALVLRGPRAAARERGRFFALRRRLSVASRERDLLQARSPGREFRLDALEELAARALQRAEAAGRGLPVVMRDEPPGPPGWLVYLRGLALSVFMVVLALLAAYRLGLDLSRYLGGDVWGLVFSAALVPALFFPLGFFAPDLKRWCTGLGGRDG